MTTRERLEKLERELADTKRKLAQAMHSVPKTTVRAKEFILEDENGKTCASLAVDKDGRGLRLYDENGTVRVSLGATKEGSALVLYNEKGKQAAALVAPNEEFAELLARHILGLGENSRSPDPGAGWHMPGLYLSDSNGKTCASVTRHALVLYDGSRCAASLVASDSGHGSRLELSHWYGRAELVVTVNGPRLDLFYENGSEVKLDVTKKDGPGLRLVSEKRKTIWSAP